MDSKLTVAATTTGSAPAANSKDVSPAVIAPAAASASAIASASNGSSAPATAATVRSYVVVQPDWEQIIDSWAHRSTATTAAAVTTTTATAAASGALSPAAPNYGLLADKALAASASAAAGDLNSAALQSAARAGVDVSKLPESVIRYLNSKSMDEFLESSVKLAKAAPKTNTTATAATAAAAMKRDGDDDDDGNADGEIVTPAAATRKTAAAATTAAATAAANSAPPVAATPLVTGNKFWVNSFLFGDDDRTVFSDVLIRPAATTATATNSAVAVTAAAAAPAVTLAVDVTEADSKAAGVSVQLLDARRLQISCTKTSVRECIVTAPSATWAHLHPRIMHRPSASARSAASPFSGEAPSLFSLAVSPDGKLGATGSTNGSIRVWNAVTGGLRYDLGGTCAGDVNHVSFFPSSQVLLSGGSDARLRIWSVEHRVVAATLTGHVRAISNAIILGRGRQLLSSSLDGCIRLWDVASQKCVHTVGPNLPLPATKGAAALPLTPVLDIALLPTDGAAAAAVDSKSALDAAVSGTLVSASEDGIVRAYDVRQSNKETYRLKLSTGAALNCVIARPNSIQSIVVGGSDGVLHIADLRNDKNAVCQFRRNDAPIHCLLAAGDGTDAVWSAAADGGCALWRGGGDATTPQIVNELSGVEYQPIYKIVRSPTSASAPVLYTSAAGSVRVYGPIRELTDPFPPPRSAGAVAIAGSAKLAAAKAAAAAAKASAAPQQPIAAKS